MRTTIILKDDLIKKASEATGIKEKTALIHKGLEALIRQGALDRLIKLGGSAPKVKVPARRRSK
jgi:Arc/MetJ family transcription regulator